LKQKSDIIGSFVQSYIQSRDGKRAEPAYSQIARSAAPEQQEKQTIRAAQEELEAEGITKAVILKHQDLIKEWLQTVVLAPTDDGKDNAEVDDDSSTGGRATERKQKPKHLSNVRICFYNRSRESAPDNKSLLGYVDFDVKDTADFLRDASGKVYAETTGYIKLKFASECSDTSQKCGIQDRHRIHSDILCHSNRTNKISSQPSNNRGVKSYLSSPCV
jgi:hypothetical protein